MSFSSDNGEDEDHTDWPQAAQNIGCYVCIVLLFAIWAFVELNT